MEKKAMTISYMNIILGGAVFIIITLLVLFLTGCTQENPVISPTEADPDCMIFEVCRAPYKNAHNASDVSICFPLFADDADRLASIFIEYSVPMSFSCQKYNPKVHDVGKEFPKDGDFVW